MNSYISCMIISEFVLYVNSYIQPNLSTTAAAADIDLAATAVDNSLTTYAAHSTSGVSILDDAEGNIKAVLGEEISDVVEASAAATMAPATLAATVSSVVAVAAKKGGVSGLIAAIFCMSSYVL